METDDWIKSVLNSENVESTNFYYINKELLFSQLPKIYKNYYNNEIQSLVIGATNRQAASIKNPNSVVCISHK